MEEFHRGPYETAVGHGRDAHRDPDPGPAAAGPAPTRRSSAGPATGRSTSAGAAVWMDGDVIADARVGLAAVGPEHDRHPGDLRGAARPGARRRSCTREAGAIAAESCYAVTDQRGTADYKRHLADELTRRTLRTAVERIRAGAAGDQGRDG